MVAPTVTTRIDWAGKGTFDGAYDTVSPLQPTPGIRISRGASADYSGEAMGEIGFELDNADHRYDPERNWAENPSFEIGTENWRIDAIAGLTAAATSIAQVTDNAGQGGSKAGAAVLVATVNSGVFIRLPYTFRAGVPYQLALWLKSATGNLNVRAGLASYGTPADLASTGSNITTSWARYTAAWTPSVSRSDVVLFVRTTTASAATVRIDAIQINPGATANAYIEGPTRGELVPGRPVHCFGTDAAVDYPKFYGTISRIVPDPANERVSITARDLQRFNDIDVAISAVGRAQGSARDLRLAILGELDRGQLNLLFPNPSFTTNTAGWSGGAGTLSRLTTDGAPGAGSACGQYVATAPDQYATFLVAGVNPIWVAGQTYRFSIYLRTTAGTQVWRLEAGPVGQVASQTVFVDAVWRRYSVTVTIATTVTDGGGLFTVALRSTTGGTVRLDAASLTRGQALYPYADTGTGRWPNFVGSGSFDGQALTGWYGAWSNLVTNPSFEASATGWTGVTRVTTAPFLGVAHGSIASAGTGAFALAGTFLAGITYRVTMALRGASAGDSATLTLGSIGTPADAASQSTGPLGTAYSTFSFSWTPAADRTDAQVKIVNSGSGIACFVDAVQVTRRDPQAATDPLYSNVGPGAGTIGSFSATAFIDGVTPKFGSYAQAITTLATAGAGRVYDFNQVGSQFRSGQPYTLSLWLRATAAMPYKVGWGANQGDGTWDEASASGTLVANTWTQVTVTWTPAADRSPSTPWNVVAYVLQTSAVAQAFLIDGVRVIPGSSADEFELAHWLVPAAAEPDVFLNTATASGTALSALAALNALTLSRHFIRPTMAPPWYQYVVEDRTTFATKTVSAAFVEDVQGFDDLAIDRSAVINIVAVRWWNGTYIASDEASVKRVGPQPGPSIAGSAYFSDSESARQVGETLVARYGFARLRPRLVAKEQYAKQLQIQLNDLVTVTMARFLFQARAFVVLREDLLITQGGRSWITTWRLEEYPY